MSKCDCGLFVLGRDEGCDAEAITLQDAASQPVRWYCTRLSHHSGDHIACNSKGEHDLFHWGENIT